MVWERTSRVCFRTQRVAWSDRADACHVQALVFAAALEATSVSVCVIAETALVVSRPTGSLDASGVRASSTCETVRSSFLGVRQLG